MQLHDYKIIFSVNRLAVNIQVVSNRSKSYTHCGLDSEKKFYIFMEVVTDPIVVSGVVEKVIYHHAEDGYTILQLQPHDKTAAKIIVTGHFPYFAGGQQVTFHGLWQEHAKHGRQFLAHRSEENAHTLPMEKFLTYYVKGIGPSYAQKLIRAFGDGLTDVINNTPERLKEIPGVGPQRYNQIITSWKLQKASLETMLFLTKHGISFFQATKIFKRYHHQTIEKVEENPYRLIQDIDGIGFLTADNLALKLNIAFDDPKRVQGAILYLLQDAAREGHCGMHQVNLVKKACELLNVAEEIILAAIETAHENRNLVKDKALNEDCVFLPLLWQQEQTIAIGLKKLINTPLLENQDELAKVLAIVIKEENLPLTDEQHDAIYQALQSRVFVLTGGPGVGKTTLIRILTRVFNKQKMSVAMAAPTGRAAKRISESTGQVAKTIHRLLEYEPITHTFAYHPKFPLPYSVIIVDESSMLDVPLCATLIDAIAPTSRIIFVGDVDQLSAVGPGDVLKSLIASKRIPFFALKTIFRQASSSQVIVNAHRVNQGLMPLIDKNVSRDFYLIRLAAHSEQQQKILSIVAEQLPQRFGFDPFYDIQVLTPMNGGPLGVDSLNDLLQQRLNPAKPGIKDIKHQGGYLRIGDKVIQVVNNYEKNVFNGDVGRIQTIDFGQKKFTVTYDKIHIEYQFKDLEQLRLAYAISIHKSQGSEYPAIVVVLSMAQRIMLKRNLLYTAITRGKSCVVVISEPEAIQCAIQRGEVTKRINKLEEWLNE